jgi:hypothetical protein
MAAVFISHSSLDSFQAATLKAMLDEMGFTESFLDFDKHQGIPLGAEWESKLYREIDRCQAMLLVLTKNWLDSKWCFAEFAQARALGKTIFVVVETPRGETAVAQDLQICDLAGDRVGGMDRLRYALKEALLVAQAGFAFPRDRAPFPGLVSFDAEDAAVFFGRDQEVAGAFEWARSERGRVRNALAIVGGSGAGKSSLLKAGILPRLHRERGAGGAQIYLIVPPLRPGETPMRELWSALRTLDPTLTRAELEAATNSSSARDLIDRVRDKAGAFQAILVIAVDQAEELFAAKDPQERRAFLAALAAFLADDNPARLLVTIRADHIDALQKEAAFADRLELLAILPMPIVRLPQIIKGPARRVDLSVDDALVEAIRADATTSDALPLVAFLLRELYDRYGKAARRLELAHYDALRLGDLSPLEAAISRKADEAVKGASEADMAALRNAFTPSLVRLDEDRNVFVRRSASRSDLPPAAGELLDALVAARLLVEGRDEHGSRIEVAHEALFRVWKTLAGWLVEEREFLIGKSRIERLFADYRALPEAQRDGGLLTGVLMERARAWQMKYPGRFHEDETAFVRASIEAAERIVHERQRAARRVRFALATAAGAFALFGGIAGIFGIIASLQRNVADEQRTRAERVESKYDVVKGAIRGEQQKLDLEEKKHVPVERRRTAGVVVSDLVQNYSQLDIMSDVLALGVQSKHIFWYDPNPANNDNETIALRKLGFVIDQITIMTVATEFLQIKPYDLIITNYGFNIDKDKTDAYQLKKAVGVGPNKVVPVVIYTLGATEEYKCTVQKDGFYDEVDMPAELIRLAIRSVQGYRPPPHCPAP